MCQKLISFLEIITHFRVLYYFVSRLCIKNINDFTLIIFTWHRTLNGKPIVPDGEHIKIVDGPDGSQCLVIDKATPEDAGVYAVVAKNSQGEITSQAPLHVASEFY